MRKFSFLILLIGLLTSFSLDLKSQEIYKVNGSTLNVRDGAGTEYKVIGKLNVDEEVVVYEINGDWAKIHLSDKEGYVNKNFLQLKSEPDAVQRKQADIFDNIWLYVIGVIVIFLLIASYRYSRKCNNCKRWNAMRKIGTKKTGEKQSTIKKTETHTDIKGNKHSNTYYVPATINYYNVHRQCKHCGFRDVKEKSEKVEN